MSEELEKLKEKISNLPDHALLKMVNVDFADYREEVINLVKEELNRRNIKEEEENIQGEEGDEEKEIKKISMKWLDFYIFICLAIIALFQFYSLFILKNRIVIIINFILLALACFTSYGLYKRQAWGWCLNNFFLISVVILIPLIEMNISTSILTKAFPISYYAGGLVRYGLLWLLPNYLYFRKRRHLFI